MLIEDSNQKYKIASEDYLKSALNIRHENNANEFWIYRGGLNSFPVISVLVRDDLAFANYLKHSEHPGFISIGNLEEIRQNPITKFFINRTEIQSISSRFVIKFLTALDVVLEFYSYKKLPTSIKWLEL